MNDIWYHLGVIRWPLLVSFLAVALLAATTAYRLLRTDAPADLRTKAWLDAILFWGGFALIAGVLGTLVGVIVAARSIEAAGGVVELSLLWGGLRVALLSSAIGAVILLLAASVWWPLQLRWRFLVARIAEE